MKTHRSILAGILVFAFVAATSAAETTSPQPLTRAQVKQATLQAKAAGELHAGDEPNYPVEPNTPPTKRVAHKKRGASTEAAAPAPSQPKQ